ncbi:MAG: hypothetical protein GY778_02480 [bacterium]|nr:hypothetical protein [bacterium]
MSPQREVTTDRRRSLSNLAIAAVTALFIWLAFWLWQDAPPHPARQRSITEMTVSWRCTAGDQFDAAGQAGTRSCPQCGAEANIIRQYRCAIHGELSAALKYGPGVDGAVVLTEIRFEGGSWEACPTRLRCPHCSAELHPVVRSIIPVEQKKEGG